MKTSGSKARGLASLRRFVTKTPETDRCDVCSVPLAEQHQHLLDPKTRKLVCACDPCAILFSSNGETLYRRVPRDLDLLTDLNLPDQVWNSLAIPIGLAFIYKSSTTDEVLAVYPSPAGPTESPLDRECWDEVVQDNPFLAKLTPDVEGLLANRIGGAREYFRAPIDECYKLTGLVKKHWRGFSGGDEAWNEIAGFFNQLRERSYPKAVNSYARSIV